MFDKKKYVEKREWLQDEYLVDPESGIKRCVTCGKLKYSVDFPNTPELFDGLLLMCTKCYCKRDGKEMLANLTIDDESMTRICRKCKVEYELSNFSYSRPRNELSSLCRKCGKWDVAAVFGTGDDDDDDEYFILEE